MWQGPHHFAEKSTMVTLPLASSPPHSPLSSLARETTVVFASEGMPALQPMPERAPGPPAGMEPRRQDSSPYSGFIGRFRSAQGGSRPHFSSATQRAHVVDA